MDDIYSAIIGEPTSDKEKLMMIANQLRKRQMLGQLGQLTGDRVLAPMGAGMVKQVGEQAEDVGRRGEQARYRQYQEGASLRSDARAKETLASNEKMSGLDRAAAMERERMGNAAMLEAARIRATQSDKEDAKLEKERRKALASGIKDLSGRLAKGRFEELDVAFKQADVKMAPYAGQDLPGFGMGKYSPLPTSVAFRAAVLAPAKNLTLAARSGATVVDQELLRLAQEMEAMSPLASDEQFLDAYGRFRERYEAQKQGIKAGFHPDIVAEYEANKERLAKGKEPVVGAKDSYEIGDVISRGGREFRVIGVDDPTDPEVEEL